HVGACPVQTVGPAVKAAHERLSGARAGVLSTRRGVDQPPTAVHAHIVVGLELVGPGTHDDDGVVEDVVGQIATHLGKLFDPAYLLPDPPPELVPLGACVAL